MTGANMKNIYVFLFVLFITGCALSPQVVVVNPELKMDANVTVAKPTTISVEVVDTRSSPIIGQRGGVYAETSNISTDDNMTATLEKKVSTAFSEMGYKVAKKGEAADAGLTVRIIDVHYVTKTEKKVLKNIETKLGLQAVCKKNGKEFTGDYSATRKKDLIKVPSMQENEQLVNEVFAVVLNSMLKDKELITFIDG
ncbi:MAG: YajG family lipoprotein [Gammaproteobacteria bacterium]